MIEPQEKIILAAYKEGQQLALDLRRILGLPEHLISLELKFTSHSLPIIKCEHYYYPDDKAPELIEALSKFELHKTTET